MPASTTNAPSHRSSTFDPVLSARLDQLIVLLDEPLPPLRRRWIRLRKLWLERHVPAWPAGGVR